MIKTEALLLDESFNYTQFDNLTEESFELLSESQQQIVENFVTSITKKLTNVITAGFKKIKTVFNDSVQSIYRKSGFIRDIAGLIIEKIDLCIRYYSTGIVQAENLVLNSKKREAIEQITRLKAERVELLKQRDIGEYSAVSALSVLKIFFTTIFFNPIRMFLYAKNFYVGIDKEVIASNVDCGASIHVGRVFELKIFLGIILMATLTAGILFSMFNITYAVIIAKGITILNSAVTFFGGLSTLGGIATIGLVFKILKYSVFYIPSTISALSMMIITRCEDGGADQLRRDEIMVREIKKTVPLFKRISLNLRQTRKRLVNSGSIYRENKSEVVMQSGIADTNKALHKFIMR